MPTRKQVKTARRWWLQYLINQLLWINQAVNTLLGPLLNLLDNRRPWGPYGKPDKTLCASAAVVLDRFGGKGGDIPWRYPLSAFIVRLTELVDRNHVWESAEDDETENGLEAP